jgi:hypothetical protein
MTMLAETFRVSVTGPMLDGYWLVLEEIPQGELRGAARRALAGSKFMPSPSELLAFARPPRNPAADAVKAWQAVRAAIDRYDYLVASIDFGPLVNAVVRNLGGWDTLCRATLPELDNPGWLRKRFEEVYKALQSSDPQTLHGAPLVGKLPPKFEGAPDIVVELDGKPVRPRLESVRQDNGSVQELVRNLADGKSE